MPRQTTVAEVLVTEITQRIRNVDEIPATISHGAAVREAIKRCADSYKIDPSIEESAFFGLPLHVDHSLPDGVAEIRSVDGRVLTRLENLS